MAKFMILITLIWISQNAFTKERIYLIDTGVLPGMKSVLCDSGHLSFDGIVRHSHGTQMAMEMKKVAKKDFCIVSIDIWSEAKSEISIKNMISTLKYLKTQPLGIINLSMSGELANYKEKILLKELADKGFKINIASGNNYKNLLFGCGVYPACYFRNSHKNIHVISNKAKYANKLGPVTHVEDEPTFTAGTSGSTAIHSAKMINIGGNFEKKVHFIKKQKS